MTAADDLFHDGKHRILYVAIEALVNAAPDRARAIATLSSAVEAEIARELYTPGRLQAWIDGLLQGQSELGAYYCAPDT